MKIYNIVLSGQNVTEHKAEYRDETTIYTLPLQKFAYSVAVNDLDGLIAKLQTLSPFGIHVARVQFLHEVSGTAQDTDDIQTQPIPDEVAL